MIKIKKYPFIKQQGIKDCAAACVFMIIRYYKGYISMNKLEKMLKTTKKGTTAYHIVKTLEEIGFKSRGIKLDNLQKTNIPFIANVIIESSYKHYIVVYKVTDKYIKIADPAKGIKNISFKQFYNMWTGINIEMYPVKLIVNEKPHTIKKIIKLIEIKKTKILIIGILSIIITIISIIGSFFFQFLIDNMNKNINNVIAFFIVLFLLKIIINYFRNKILINLTNNIDKKITTKIFSNIIFLPYQYYHNHTTGEIISKINDLAVLREIIGKTILTIFIDLPLTIFSGLILYKINKTLFLIVISILLSYLFILFLYHKKTNNQINKTLKQKASINSFMTESISGFETIKGLNIENKITGIFENKYHKYSNTRKKLNNILNRQNTFKDFIDTLGNIFILIIGIKLVQNKIIPLSTLITYNILVAFFLEPVKNIIALDFEIKEAFNSINRVLDFNEKEEKSIQTSKSDILIENLKFTLDYNNYILDDINLKIKEKEKVLITGPSGSGKSTLLKIIKGYYKDYEGKVSTNNKNIVFVSDKSKIFTGTLKQNLTLKNKNINNNIKICCVDDIIKNYELGINELLEENGYNLSHGQRQRICLARATHNFNILLIDEGLNGLDVNLERKILKNIFKNYQNKTIIIVSHRLDNLDLFNHYIKLEKGKIVIDATFPRKER